MKQIFVDCDGCKISVEFELTDGHQLFWRAALPDDCMPLLGMVSGIAVDAGRLQEAVESSVREAVKWRASQNAR